MRKVPRQKRSRLLVQSILDGARLAIIEEGLNQVTTHHIAAKSGVSVGSIYQYFHNKDEIIDAIVDRIIADAFQLGIELIGRRDKQDLQSALRMGFEQIFSFIYQDEELHLEILANIQLIDSQRFFDEVEKHFIEVMIPFLSGYQSQISNTNLRPILFIAVNSVVFTIVQHLTRPTPYASDEELIEYLSRMIVAVLTSPQ